MDAIYSKSRLIRIRFEKQIQPDQANIGDVCFKPDDIQIVGYR